MIGLARDHLRTPPRELTLSPDRRRGMWGMQQRSDS
jgi:hypothetical protein